MYDYDVWGRFMIEKIAEVIINYLYAQGYIKNNIAVYRYGTEILISSLIGFSITLILGFVFNAFIDSILYLVLFVTLRKRTGGYHASTYLGCNFAMIISFLGYLLFIKLDPPISYYYLAILISLVIIIHFAPLENSYKKIINQALQKKWSIFLSFSYALIFFLLFLSNSRYALLPLYVLQLVAVYILIGRRKLKHEQDNNVIY